MFCDTITVRKRARSSLSDSRSDVQSDAQSIDQVKGQSLTVIKNINGPGLDETRYNRLRKLLGGQPKYIYREFQVDSDGLSYMTAFSIGREICDILRRFYQFCYRNVVTDAFAGAGGNTIVFASYFSRVNAVELEQKRSQLLLNNVDLFRQDNVMIHVGYYQKFMYSLKQDIIYFDPPWGNDYKSPTSDKLRIKIEDPDNGYIELEELIILVAPYASVIVVKLPISYDTEYFTSRIKTIGAITNSILFGRPNSSIFKFIDVDRN